jgi:hypothetical protein
MIGKKSARLRIMSTTAVIAVRGAVKTRSPWVDSTSGPPMRIDMKEGRKVKKVTTVAAAILSNGAVTVFTRAEKYEYATLYIKDWITLANSGHVCFWEQPANVQMVKLAL